MRFTTILLIALIAFSAVANGANVAPAKRRLGIPSWAKNALKGCAGAVIDTIVTCISDQIKSLGVAQLSKIPGVKMVANKLVGKAIDALASKVKQVVTTAVNKAIDSLRRRRRLWWNPVAAIGNAAHAVGNAVHGAANAVGNAAHNAVNAVGNAVHSAADAVKNAAAGVGNAVENAAAFVKNGVVDTVNAGKAFAASAAKVAGEVANEAHKIGVTINNLTGGKLAAAMKNTVCPLISTATKSALTYALVAIGWPFGVPACLFTAVTHGCQAAIDAAFKRMVRRLRRRHLAKNRKLRPNYHWSRHHRRLAKHRKLRHRKLRGHWSRHHRVLAKERKLRHRKLRGHWSRHHRVLAQNRELRHRKLRGHWSRHHRVLAKERKLRHGHGHYVYHRHH